MAWTPVGYNPKKLPHEQDHKVRSRMRWVYFGWIGSIRFVLNKFWEMQESPFVNAEARIIALRIHNDLHRLLKSMEDRPFK